jgi:2'-5' RNA ligase
MEEIRPTRRIYDKRFDHLWNEFQNGYKPAIYNPEQAAGCNERKDSLMLSIGIEQPEVIERIQSVASRLRQIPGIYVMPTEYYHVTVKWLGFLTDKKEHDYDIEPPVLEQILEQADQIFSQIPAFSVRLGSVNGLASFIIIEAEDNGAIAQIQGRFHEEATLVPNYAIEGEKWLPHLSIAGLKSQEGLKEIKVRMNELRDVEIGELWVPRIDLSQAILQKPCPQCRIVRSFPLLHRDLPA